MDSCERVGAAMARDDPLDDVAAVEPGRGRTGGPATCRELGIAFVACSPLRCGFLAGVIPNRAAIDATVGARY